MIKYFSQYRSVKTLKRVFYQLAFISLILLISRCGEEPSFLGRNLLPPTDNIAVHIDSMTLLSAFTTTAKPIITSANEQYIIGSINDPVFGYSDASIVTHLDAISPKSLPVGRIIDSLIVQLKVKGYFGDSTAIQRISVYEVIDSIRTDTVYFSNTNTDNLYYPVELGTVEFLPTDSLIRFHVTNTVYMDKFAYLEDTVFSRNNYFQQVFKGLYFQSDTQTEEGGALTYLDLDSQDSRMILYYDTEKTDNDTVNLTYLMYFGYYSNKFNVFRSDYTSYPPSVGLDDPNTTDTVLFCTSMAGLDIRILFPELIKWRERAPISIVKAELVIGVEDVLYEYDDEEKYPKRLFLYTMNEKNTYDILYDYRINAETFGGFYDKNEKAYKLNIAYYLQSYIDKRIDNTELALITINNNSTANRVILKSPLSASKNRMKLRVIYVKI